jgi:hypothetical protein
MYLPRFGIYTSLIQNGSSTGWFSGRTLPPEAAVREPADLRVRSARLYGHDPVEVEAQILAEIGVAAVETTKRSDPEDRIGRRPETGAQS